MGNISRVGKAVIRRRIYAAFKFTYFECSNLLLAYSSSTKNSFTSSCEGSSNMASVMIASQMERKPLAPSLK